MGACSSSSHYDSPVEVEKLLLTLRREYITYGKSIHTNTIYDLGQVLAGTTQRALRQVQIESYLELVRDRFLSNPLCSAHQIIYEICQGLYEWQLLKDAKRGIVSPPSLFTRIPPSTLLPKIPAPQPDFHSWIVLLHEQMVPRLATVEVMMQDDDVHLLVNALQSTMPEFINVLQPGFIDRLFQMPVNVLDRLIPVQTILLNRIEVMEQLAPGTLAAVLDRLYYPPQLSNPRSVLAHLYRLTFQYQSPPGSNVYVNANTDRFLTRYVRIGVDTDAIERIIHMITRTDMDEFKLSRFSPTTASRESTANSESTSITVPVDETWNRPTLLPGVNRRAFLNEIESVILWKCPSMVRKNWWISSNWCREEICWPLEILRRERSNVDNLPLTRDEEWIFFQESEHWVEMISPILIAFDQFTPVITDLVVHEILPFLHASLETPAATSSGTFALLPASVILDHEHSIDPQC